MMGAMHILLFLVLIFTVPTTEQAHTDGAPTESVRRWLGAGGDYEEALSFYDAPFTQTDEAIRIRLMEHRSVLEELGRHGEALSI